MSQLLKYWAPIAAALTALILVFTFILKGWDVFELVAVFISSAPEPNVAMTVTKVVADNDCVEFSFTSLPENFALGAILLNIESASGPYSHTGQMAAETLVRKINYTVSSRIFSGELEEIRLNARFESTKNNDVAYVDFCPGLSMRGQFGELTFTPNFLDPSGTKISELSIIGERYITISLSHPKNLTDYETTDFFGLISR